MNARPRGQMLLLMVLVILVVVVLSFLSLSIGVRVREKIKLQATADSAAYSMAVVEARAMNFFALSNRAMASHMVSTLAAFGHTSYATWYYAMLREQRIAYAGLASSMACTGTDGQARTRARKVAQMFAAAMPVFPDNHAFAGKSLMTFTSNAKYSALFSGDPYKSFWYYQPSTDRLVEKPLTNTSDATLRSLFARIPADMAAAGIAYQQPWPETECAGRATECNFDKSTGPNVGAWTLVGPRGQHFIEGHLSWKADGAWCGTIDDGGKDQLAQARVIRVHQRNVYAQMKGLLSGQAFSIINSAATPTPQSLPDAFAKSVDPKLTFRVTRQDSAGTLTDINYENFSNAAVDVQRKPGAAGQDFAEVVNASRFPYWISARAGGSDIMQAGNGKPDQNLIDLVRVINKTIQAMPGGGGDSIRVVVRGSGSAKSAPSVSSRTVPAIVASLESGQIGKGSLGAEDHAQLWSYYRPAGCAEQTRPPITMKKLSLVSNTNNRHLHTFPENGGSVWADVTGAIYEPVPPGAQLPQGEMYYGHVRYRGSTNANALWNMPRTISMMNKDMATMPTRPWDFRFNIALGSQPWTLDTKNSKGDRSGGAAQTMAAVGGGLVYYHHPAPSRGAEGYKEHPNLWNPFWRAKLHPVEAATVQSLQHPGTATVLGNLGAAGQQALNY